MKFNFYEEQKLRDVVENNNTGSLTISSAIWYAAVYYTHIKPISNKKELFNKIVEFIRNNYDGFRYEGYVNLINTRISKAKSHNITDISTVPITASELNKIQSLNNQCMEKLAFVVLALAKYENLRSNSCRDTFYAKVPEIFRLARLAVPKNERNKYLHEVYKEGIISMNFSIGYDAITVGFVSHGDNDPVVLELDEYDYMELAYAYLNYRNGGYKRCKECNKWFRVRNNAEQYCKEHKKDVVLLIEKDIECIECGKIFTVKAKDNQTCRCEDCQSRYRRNYKTLKQQEYRLKNVDSTI